MKGFNHRIALGLLLAVSFSAQAAPQARSDEFECRQSSLLRVITIPACEMVSGTVTYRERIALPTNAIVRVTLEAVGSEILAEQTIETQGKQVPIPFSLTYDASGIQEETAYVIRAQIFVDQQLRFAGEITYPTASNEKVEVIVRSTTPSPR